MPIKLQDKMFKVISSLEIINVIRVLHALVVLL